MARFLSPEWIDELDRAARACARDVSNLDETLIVEQVVTGVPGRGEVRYQVRFEGAATAVRRGSVDEPTVTITLPYDTAVGISTGHESAQRAFMAGMLRLGGDVGSLLRQRERLTDLGDLFADVRPTTTY